MINGQNTYDGFEVLDGSQVFEVVGVGDLTRSPLALVRRVVNHGGVPLALVSRVGLEGARNRTDKSGYD